MVSASAGGGGGGGPAWRVALRELEAAADGAAPAAVAEHALAALREAAAAAAADPHAWKGAAKGLAALRALPGAHVPPGAWLDAADALGRTQQWARLDAAEEALRAGTPGEEEPLPPRVLVALALYAGRRRDAQRALALLAEARDAAAAAPEQEEAADGNLGTDGDQGSLAAATARAVVSTFANGVAPLWEDALEAVCGGAGDEGAADRALEVLRAVRDERRPGVSRAELATRTVAWMRAEGGAAGPGPDALEALLAVFVIEGRSTDALDALEEFREAGGCVDVREMNSALSACKKAGDWATATALLGRMKAWGVALDEFTSSLLVSTARAAGGPDAAANARWALGEVRALGATPNAFSYNALVAVHASRGELEEARAVLEEMAGEGVEPDVYTFQPLLNTTAKRAAVDDVVEQLGDVLGRMGAAGVRPNGASLASIAVQLNRRGMPEDALRFVLGAGDGGAPPALGDLATCVEHLSNDGRHEAALELCDAVEVDTDDAEGAAALLEAALQASAAAGDYDAAKAILGSLDAVGIPLSSGGAVAVLRAADRAGGVMKLQEATALVQSVTGPGGLGLETWNEVLKLFAAKGQWMKALRTFEQVENAGLAPNLRTWEIMAMAAERSGQWRLVADVFADARAAGAGDLSVVLACAVRAAAKAGEWSTVRAYLEDARADGLHPTGPAYEAIVTSAATRGQPEIALDAFEDALLLKVGCNEPLWALGIQAAGQRGEWERAVRYLEEVEAAGAAIGSTYTTALAALAEAARPEEAREVLERMRKAGHDPTGDAHAALVEACGAGEGAEAALKATFAQKPTLPAFVALLKVLASSGKWQAALKTLEEMKRLEVAPDETAYAYVVDALWRADQQAKALSVMKDMLKQGMFSHTVRHGPWVPPWKRNVREPKTVPGWPEQPAQWASHKVVLDVRRLPPGAAAALVILWLANLNARVQRGLAVPPGLQIVTGWRTAAGGGSSAVREAVLALLDQLGSPFTQLTDSNPGLLNVLGGDLERWLQAGAVFDPSELNAEDHAGHPI